jgi:hypothetical protein
VQVEAAGADMLSEASAVNDFIEYSGIMEG